MIIWTICGWLVGTVLALFLLGVVFLLLTFIICGLQFVIAKATSKENWITKIFEDF